MVQFRHVVAGALCFPQLVQGALQTSFGINDCRKINREHAAKKMHFAALAALGDNASDYDPTLLYPQRSILVPVDHFHNDSLYEPHTNDTFELHYWFDPTYYKKGGPIIVQQAGETDGIDRLPNLQKGIISKLAKATGGMGVVLEHRFYGDSVPYGNFKTDNLRFLTTDQALADMAYFAQTVVFEGFEQLNLTSSKNPYIAYGGSYAGAFVAFLRKTYPDVYWGAIASSAVTEAIYDFWQYYEAPRIYGPPDCIVKTQKLVHVLDSLLLDKPVDDEMALRLKGVFGLANVTHHDDFAYSITWGPAYLQLVNWDPEVNVTGFGDYCGNISSTALLWPELAAKTTEVQELLTSAGYGGELDTLTTSMLNWIGHVNATEIEFLLSTCTSNIVDDCFTQRNATFWAQDDVEQYWRPWAYQYCSEYGYILTGSGYPEGQLPLVPRLRSLEYLTVVCRDAFGINGPPNLDAINKFGGYNISYPRLAFIDGERDPWRAATPHAVGLNTQWRAGGISEPFLLIPNGVHHWDQNGVFPNETRKDFPPKEVQKIQDNEVIFVKAWVKEWNDYPKRGPGGGGGGGGGHGGGYMYGGGKNKRRDARGHGLD